MYTTTNGNGTATPKINSASEVTRTGPAARVVLYGANIAHKELDKRQLAVVGADILDGRAWFVPTQAQLATCLRVCSSYIELAKTLSPTKRAAILEGRDATSFADLLLLRRLASTNTPVIPDRALVAMATHIGSAERWLAAGTAAGLR